MKNLINIKFISVAVVARLFLPVVAFAADAFSDPGATPGGTLTKEGLVDVLCTAIVWMFDILIVLSVVMVLVGAYLYVTSGGSSDKVGKATKTITYAALGVAVALFAYGVPTVIISILSDDSAGVLDSCSIL